MKREPRIDSLCKLKDPAQVLHRTRRRILVDAARARQGAKRHGDFSDTSLDEAFVFRPEKSSDLLALDEALTRLSEVDARKSQIVERAK
jgi:hypothetical protein